MSSISAVILLFPRSDLCCKSFAHIDDLSPSCRQGPKNAYIFVWQSPTGVWPEQHEARDELGVDPISLGSRAPRHCEGLDLCRR